MAVPYSALAKPARSLPGRTTEEDGSLLRSLMDRSLSGVAAVGNALDLPGSSARDLLAGRNPFDQLLSPLSDKNRTTGRELGEMYGLLGPNQKGKLDAGDLGGFAAEVALDPLSYLTFGASALGKGGQVLKKAGAVKGLNRVGRMTTKVKDLAANAKPDALEAAAKASGLSGAADLLSRHGDDAVGGMVGLGLPFKAPSTVLGTGPLAQKIGGALDKVGEAARFGKIPGTNFSPGAQLGRVFSPASQGLHTPEVQKFSKDIDLWNERELIETGVRADVAKEVTKLRKAGAFDDEASVLGRMAAENRLDMDALTPAARAKAELMSKVVAPISKSFQTLQRQFRENGLRLDPFGDPSGIAYWPREFVDYVQNFANTMPRQEYLRGLMEGTEQLRKVISDPKIAELPFDEAVRYFEDTYGAALKTANPPSVSVTPASLNVQPLELPGNLSPSAMRSATGVPTVTPAPSLSLNPSGRGLSPGELQAEIAKRGAVNPSGPPKPTVSAGAPRKIGPRKTTVTGGSIDVGKFDTSGAKRQALVEQLVHRIQNVYTPEQRAVGGFGRDMLLDAQQAQIGMKWKLKRADAMLQGLKSFAKPLGQHKTDTRSIGEILELAGMKATDTLDRADDAVSGVVRQAKSGTSGQVVETGALHKLADLMGLGHTPESLEQIANLHVSADIADDMVRLIKGDDIKQVVGPLMQMFDSMTNIFKVGVLNWPARYVRDYTSSQAMNVLTGNFSHTAHNRMHQLLAGDVVDFTDLPVVRGMLAERGLEETAENSTDIVRELFYTYEKHTAVAGHQGTSEIVGELSGALPGGTKAFAGEFPGLDPLSPLSPSTFNAGAPLNTLDAWTPWNVRGVGGRLKSGAKPVAIGERLGRYTDSMGRGTAFIANLEKGVAPEQASRIADAIQVNYSPRNYTAAERKYLKRAFPFYSFTSRMLPFVTRELLEKPGGGIAQAIRGQNAARSDEPLPEYLSNSLAIPLGELPDGSKRYLTALDMMHDAPLSVLQTENGLPSLSGTTRNVLSQMNPYPKALTELAFGRTLFQDRELAEADPTIGRLISNVSELTGFGPRESASGRAEPFLSPTFEHLAANSPASRLLSSARVATDPRKYEGAVPGLGAAANLLTGARVSDISPANQDAVLRDAAANAMKQAGAGNYEVTRFSKSQIESAPAEEQELMLKFNAIMDELASRAKARKQQK